MRVDKAFEAVERTGWWQRPSKKWPTAALVSEKSEGEVLRVAILI